MNITEYMDLVLPPPLTLAAVRELIVRRRDTYTGFAEIETSRGVLQPSVSLNTSRGQEMLRVLFFRVIEEAVESYMADDPMHVKEEAIDAINYLWSTLIIDPARFSIDSAAQIIYDVFARGVEVTHVTSLQPFGAGGYSVYHNYTLDHEDLGQIAIWVAGDVGDLMRNRAWMTNSQDIYFQGTEQLKIAVQRVTARLSEVFSNWDEFYRYYVAKDEVLKFRLRTHY